jgi:hypothetical protein
MTGVPVPSGLLPPPAAPAVTRTMLFTKPSESLGAAGRAANPAVPRGEQKPAATLRPVPATQPPATQPPITPPPATPPAPGYPGASGGVMGQVTTDPVSPQYAPPGFEQVFGHLDSEQTLEERLRQGDKQEQFRPEGRPSGQSDLLPFPPMRPLSQVAYTGRSFNPLTVQVEPNFVCYRRLYFEQPNMERYGWDLGPITPFVCALEAGKDYLLMPYNSAKQPFHRFDCGAGYCLPGSPTPLLIYPPELSLTGALWETGVVVTLFALFP